jgi:uncharacterized protein (TIGR02646 family)
MPSILKSRRASAARKAAEDFYGPGRHDRMQTRHTFQVELWKGAVSELRRLFRAKCAYCERRFERPEAILVDHFRPINHAKQIGGAASRDHYWWLAYDWENLYPACAECHRHKATLFPVRGKRADPGTRGEDLRNEVALLLDPCVDDPEKCLYFKGDGTVLPVGKGHGVERAEATIEVLSLNRRDLVRGRALAIEEAVAACEALSGRRKRLVGGGGAAMSHPAARVRRLLAPWLPFCAARRQAVRRELHHMGGYGDQIVSLLPDLFGSDHTSEEVHVRPPLRRKHRTAYVRELKIQNFKAIHRLELAFADSLPTSADSPAADWRVFIGENGAGKSSVLQALALALAGDYQVRNTVINWDKVLRRSRGKRKRPREGFVKVLLSTGDLIDLRFNSKKAWFKSGGEGALTTLRAYGATRNLPNTRAPASWKSVESMIRIINLFDPNSPLCSAEGWMAGLTKPRFDVVALTLKDLMQLAPSDRLRREKRYDSDLQRNVLVPIVDMGSSSNRFDELSDGYQSMIAVVADLMAGLSKKTTDYQTECGIVLIDELGNHLHPRWRMQVVASLRRAFPRIQFIVTTHEPLCLRGLEVGEIAVLRREGPRITAQVVNESVAHLRADQLLTSPLFGLISTRDPEALKTSQIDERRYDELFLKANRSAVEESELQTLRAAIVSRTASGERPVDRFVEKAVRAALTQLTREPPDLSRLASRPTTKAVRSALEAKFTELLR